MITIDKLCYHSGLRYENAGEKFAFAVVTLIICVMSRSMAVAAVVLAVMGGAHRMEREDPSDPLSAVSDCTAGFSGSEHGGHHV